MLVIPVQPVVGGGGGGGGGADTCAASSGSNASPRPSSLLLHTDRGTAPACLVSSPAHARW